MGLKVTQRDGEWVATIEVEGVDFEGTGDTKADALEMLAEEVASAAEPWNDAVDEVNAALEKASKR